MRTKLTTILTVAIVFSASLARAAGEAGHGIRGWGPRVGFAADPDQLVIGAHMDAGRLAPRVRFQPDVELGVGDNVVILGFTAPVHYLFKVSGDIQPYAGGGVTLGFVNVDNGDDDVEAALDLIGGLEWSMKSGNLFFTEFDIMVGDLQDFQIIAGWTFR
jgi:opacity protein-like surface antigen